MIATTPWPVMALALLGAGLFLRGTGRPRSTKRKS